MAVSIRSPRFSFVRFGSPADNYNTCSDTTVGFCLPVFAQDDVAFQFVALAESAAEAAAICTSETRIGLVRDCEQEGFDLEFEEAPEVVRISELEVLFNWPHGFPGFSTEFAKGECFRIRVEIDHPTAGLVTACSNCFERIGQDCFSSVLEYGGEENQFGFNYCGGGGLFEDEEESEPCAEPLIIEFTDVSVINEPYTAGMRSTYGDVPTVEIWILENGEYVQPMVRAGFDAYPPTMIIADLGGPASGFLKIS